MSRHAPIVRVARGKPGVASVPGSSTPVPLPDAERSYFEGALQHDFSDVRVHTGAPAAAAASARGAKAYTDGSDIAFAAGRYAPGTPSGRELLAHELVHVAQQSRGGSGSGAEARAKQAGAKAARGETAPAAEQGGAGSGVQCDDDDKTVPVPATVPPPPVFAPLTLPALGSSLSSTLKPPRLGDSLRAPLLTPGPALSAPFAMPGPSLTPQFVLPPLTLPTGPDKGVPSPALSALEATKLPIGKMDNADLLSPFAFHGVSPGQLHINITGDWTNAYFMFRGYLPESLAIKSANMFLSGSYKAMLERDYPSVMDTENRRFKEAHPEGFSTPQLPLLPVLNPLLKKVLGKEIPESF